MPDEGRRCVPRAADRKPARDRTRLRRHLWAAALFLVAGPAHRCWILQRFARLGSGWPSARGGERRYRHGDVCLDRRSRRRSPVPQVDRARAWASHSWHRLDARRWRGDRRQTRDVESYRHAGSDQMSDTASIIGSRLGAYEIGAKLGAGGMGEVFRARDTKLGRDVAIKILPASFAADPDRLARSEREARVLASLNPP